MPDSERNTNRRHSESAADLLKRLGIGDMEDVDEALDSLAEELTEAREKLRTERFLGFVLLLIGLTAYILTWSDGLGVAAFVALQIVFLVILANYLKVRAAQRVFNKILVIFTKIRQPHNTSPPP